MRTVTLYTKPDCPLCEKAERLLRRLQGEFPFDLDVIDITKDEALFERYCLEVPVVAIEGAERFFGRVPEGELREALREAL